VVGRQRVMRCDAIVNMHVKIENRWFGAGGFRCEPRVRSAKCAAVLPQDVSPYGMGAQSGW